MPPISSPTVSRVERSPPHRAPQRVVWMVMSKAILWIVRNLPTSATELRQKIEARSATRRAGPYSSVDLAPHFHDVSLHRDFFGPRPWEWPVHVRRFAGLRLVILSAQLSTQFVHPPIVHGRKCVEVLHWPGRAHVVEWAGPWAITEGLFPVTLHFAELEFDFDS